MLSGGKFSHRETMGACSSRVVDVIPEKEVMYEIVEAILRFEEMAKCGEKLTKAQKKQKVKLDHATRAFGRVVKVNEDTRV